MPLRYIYNEQFPMRFISACGDSDQVEFIQRVFLEELFIDQSYYCFHN